MSCSTLGPLWLDRLSMTPMSPFERGGTRHFSTHSPNEAALIGRAKALCPTKAPRRRPATSISPRRSRRDLALGFEARHPAHGAGDADPKTLGCRVARHATFHHRPHNAFAKIVGKRHPRRLLRTATIFKQIKADSGIPPTIQFARRPL